VHFRLKLNFTFVINVKELPLLSDLYKIDKPKAVKHIDNSATKTKAISFMWPFLMLLLFILKF
jgi:hypothetical protein